MPSRDSKTLNSSPEGVKEYHVRYLMAVNNPIRRKILRVLNEGEATKETLQLKTGLDIQTLEWHLSILEYGSCVEKTAKDEKISYRLTKEGKVVEYIEG